MHTETIGWHEFYGCLQIVSILIGIINIVLLFALISKLGKCTVDDPTGEKKQKIFDSLTQAIEDVKSTV